jgi:membrane dipeptidase
MRQPVYDYSAGKPWILNNHLRSLLDDADGNHDPAVATQFQLEMVAEYRTDETLQRELRTAYDEAGVNLSSVTLLGRDSSELFMGFEQIYRSYSRWTALFDAIEWLEKVTTPQAARRVVDNDKVGIILNVQNLGPLTTDDIDQVERLHNLGICMMQFTYNRQNDLGSGCTEPADGGLSYRGLDVLERMNELGSIVDLSHCGPKTTLDAIEHSEAPPCFSHGFSTEISNHARGKSDEELAALAEADGFIGINSLKFFLDPDGNSDSFEIFFDHLADAIQKVSIDNVGIGSDFSEVHDADFHASLLSEKADYEAGWRDEHGVDRSKNFDEFNHFSDWHIIREGIRDRYNETEARKLLGENFLKYWERVHAHSRY